MPTTTFFNLPEQKRSRFIDEAFFQFALNDYQHASITTLVKKLDIAKGSVYQYFTNKKELYHYLIELATQEKLAVTGPLIDKLGSDPWKWYRKLFTQSILFDLQNPVLGCFMLNVTHERNSTELGNRLLVHKQESVDFYVQVLRKFRKKGKLSKSVRLGNAAFVMSQIAFGLLDGICLEHNIDLRQHATERTSVTAIGESEVKNYMKEVASALAEPLLL